MYRRTRGGITRPWKVNALLLTTHGRRSGLARTVVLQFFPDGDAMVLAAANDGGASHPGWYFNLLADGLATAEVMGKTIPVRAEGMPEDDARQWWQRIVERAPGYERYARATSRPIPIVRLVPIDEQPATSHQQGRVIPRRIVISHRIGQAVLALSALGFPMTQLLIRRFGVRGALAAEAVSGGLLIRDASMLAAGAPDRLRRGPAVLLWLETAVAATAVLAGLRPIFDSTARQHAAAARPDALEATRRAAVGTLFGLHTMRFRIYLQPDHGRRPISGTATS